MNHLKLPDVLVKFLSKMEKVHAFGAAIPNLVHFLIPSKSIRQPIVEYKERGFISNIGLYVCGSDLEMIII